MREIKFRGKSALDYDDKWIYGGILYFCGRPQITYETDCFVSRIGIIPETLGQYTGLKDKNGVEIYEGDVVDTMALGMFEVIFDCGAFRIACEGLKFTMIDGSYYEVVGNVHNSPELLKK